MTSSYRGERPCERGREESRVWPPIRHELPDYSDFTQDLIEHTQDLLCVHDLEGRLLAVNPGPARVLGYTVEELLRIPMRELIAPQYRPAFDEYLGTVARDGEARGLMAVLTRSGEQRIWEYHNTLRTEGVPTPVVRGLAHDVTERLRAEKELREAIRILTQTAHEQERTAAALRASEERLRLAQEVAGIGTFDRNLVTGEMRWTPHMGVIFGLQPDDFPKTVDAFLELVHQEDRLRVSGLVDESMESGQGHGEWRIVRPDGTMRWISGQWKVFKDANGRPERLIGADIDITERKQAEEALRNSEQEQFEIAKQLENESARLIEAQAVAKVGSWETELPSLNVSWSEQTHRIFETDPSHFHPSRPDFVKLIHPEDRAKVDAAFQASLTKQAPSTVEYRTVMADGRVKIVEEHWKVTHNEQGQPIRLTGTCQDITEHKRIEQELQRAQERLTEEKLYLEQEIDTAGGFEEILGQSEALKAVMESVSKVATADATVLLLGETGTGKELVARAIHRLSRRSGNAFIKLNCAAIPSGLMESELFGHEKGAFTGAVARKVGRLELADRGTLFLDEIGEIPLLLQPKLLRVLQDMEFERLGGTQTLKVNFRLIAATNRDLAESVRGNEFRRDLYYRLNVFPIRIPRLRERREDIRLLAEHFVQKFARRMNKKITSIPRKTMDALMEWEWPGNVRELENFIERSVILTQGSVLVAPLSELGASKEVSAGETLAEAEREHILRALRDSHGRIAGPRGAAARLGLKRTTLQSKLKQMGIDRRAEDD